MESGDGSCAPSRAREEEGVAETGEAETEVIGLAYQTVITQRCWSQGGPEEILRSEEKVSEAAATLMEAVRAGSGVFCCLQRLR